MSARKLRDLLGQNRAESFEEFLAESELPPDADPRLASRVRFLRLMTTAAIEGAREASAAGIEAADLLADLAETAGMALAGVAIQCAERHAWEAVCLEIGGSVAFGMERVVTAQMEDKAP